MLTPAKKQELVKIAVLSILAEPENRESGATLTDISRALNFRDKAKAGGDPRLRGRETFGHETLKANVLDGMSEAGLIVRDEADRKKNQPKPYHITDEGMSYLEAAQAQAMSTTPGQRQDWANGLSGSGLQEELAASLRSLPEFRDSGEARIQEVGEQLAQVITRTATR